MPYLYLLKFSPLFLELAKLNISCTFNCFILELKKLLLGPKTGYITLLREAHDHLVPGIAYILFIQHEQSINYQDSILINFRTAFIKEKNLVEDIYKLWLTSSFISRQNQTFWDSNKNFSPLKFLLGSHSRVRQSIFEMELRREQLRV